MHKIPEKFKHQKVCISLSPELLERIDEYVDDNPEMKRSRLIAEAVKMFLKKKAK